MRKTAFTAALTAVALAGLAPAAHAGPTDKPVKAEKPVKDEPYAKGDGRKN
jgi:hypothetical protein